MNNDGDKSNNNQRVKNGPVLSQFSAQALSMRRKSLIDPILVDSMPSNTMNPPTQSTSRDLISLDHGTSVQESTHLSGGQRSLSITQPFISRYTKPTAALMNPTTETKLALAADSKLFSNPSKNLFKSHKPFVMQEDRYLDSLRFIISRDFHPNAYQELLQERGKREDNGEKRTDFVETLSLNDFSSVFTTEDTASAERLLDADEEARKQKLWWTQLAVERQTRSNERALQIEHQNDPNYRQSKVNSWDYDVKNSLMFHQQPHVTKDILALASLVHKDNLQHQTHQLSKRPATSTETEESSLASKPLRKRVKLDTYSTTGSKPSETTKITLTQNLVNVKPETSAQPQDDAVIVQEDIGIFYSHAETDQDSTLPPPLMPLDSEFMDDSHSQQPSSTVDSSKQEKTKDLVSFHETTEDLNLYDFTQEDDVDATPSSKPYEISSGSSLSSSSSSSSPSSSDDDSSSSSDDDIVVVGVSRFVSAEELESFQDTNVKQEKKHKKDRHRSKNKRRKRREQQYAQLEKDLKRTFHRVSKDETVIDLLDDETELEPTYRAKSSSINTNNDITAMVEVSSQPAGIELDVEAIQSTAISLFPRKHPIRYENTRFSDEYFNKVHNRRQRAMERHRIATLQRQAQEREFSQAIQFAMSSSANERQQQTSLPPKQEPKDSTNRK